MRYADVVGQLYGLSPRGMRLGLGRMQRACALRGHPERKTPVIHVAGTNGKGSLVATLDAVLGAAGYRVGAFTSPHLHAYTERFRIAGQPVSKRALASRASDILSWMGQRGTPRLTFFEVSTLLAFELFAGAGCDVALIEVGLGGRLDSTNVVAPTLTAITQIGLDHADRLGHTLAEIAREKAGIIKPGVPLVVGTRGASAQRAITRIARERKAPCVRIDRDFGAEEHAGKVDLWAGEQRIRGLTPKLLGAHQLQNLATAFACVEQLRAQGYVIGAGHVRKGVRMVDWPARLEWLSGRPRVLLDAAHNPDGALALRRYLEARPRPRGKRVLLFGAMADKQADVMLESLRGAVDCLVLSQPPGARAAELSALRKPHDRCEEDPRRALRTAESLAGAAGEVVVAGSIFLAAAVRAARLGIRPEPAVRL